MKSDENTRKVKPLAIIGLDPGTTAAYAIVDLHGNILGLNSYKEYPLSQIISEVIAVCHPVIVSTDKAKIPSFVGDFATKLGCTIVAPVEDLKKEEKRELIKSTLHSPEIEQIKDDFLAKGTNNKETLKGENGHQNDSLAAAIFAYKKYYLRLSKIYHFLQNNPLGEKEPEFIRMALREDLHFTLIKNILTQPMPEHTIIKEVLSENKITKTDFLRLFQKVSILKEEKRQLLQKLDFVNHRAADLKKINLSLKRKRDDEDKRLDILLRFKEERIKVQSQKIEQMLKFISSLREKEKNAHSFILQMDEFTLVKKMNNLGIRELSETNKHLQIKENDCLWIENPQEFSEEALRILKEKGVAILSNNPIPKRIKEEFITGRIASSDVHLQKGHFALIHPETLDSRLEKKTIIEKIIDEYRESRN